MSNNKEIFEFNNPNVKFGFVPNIILNLKEMGDNKQSSIDKFVQQLKRKGLLITEDSEYIVAYLEAKAMHKEEVRDAYREGRTDQQSNEKFYHRNAQLYFNETFGGNNE